MDSLRLVNNSARRWPHNCNVNQLLIILKCTNDNAHFVDVVVVVFFLVSVSVQAIAINVSPFICLFVDLSTQFIN